MAKSTLPHLDASGRPEGLDDPLEGLADLDIRKSPLGAAEFKLVRKTPPAVLELFRLEYIKEFDSGQLLAAVFADDAGYNLVGDRLFGDDGDIAGHRRILRTNYFLHPPLHL